LSKILSYTRLSDMQKRCSKRPQLLVLLQRLTTARSKRALPSGLKKEKLKANSLLQ